MSEQTQAFRATFASSPATASLAWGVWREVRAPQTPPAPWNCTAPRSPAGLGDQQDLHILEELVLQAPAAIPSEPLPGAGDAWSPPGWFQHSRAAGMGSQLGFNPAQPWRCPRGMLWGGIQQEQLLQQLIVLWPGSAPAGDGRPGIPQGMKALAPHPSTGNENLGTTSLHRAGPWGLEVMSHSSGHSHQLSPRGCCHKDPSRSQNSHL